MSMETHNNLMLNVQKKLIEMKLEPTAIFLCYKMTIFRYSYTIFHRKHCPMNKKSSQEFVSSE